MACCRDNKNIFLSLLRGCYYMVSLVIILVCTVYIVMASQIMNAFKNTVKKICDYSHKSF